MMLLMSPDLNSRFELPIFSFFFVSESILCNYGHIMNGNEY